MKHHDDGRYRLTKYINQITEFRIYYANGYRMDENDSIQCRLSLEKKR